MCLICRKKIISIHWSLYYEIIKLYNYLLIAPFWYFMSTGSELDLQLVSQSSTGNMWQGYQKKLLLRSVTVYNKSLYSQCNLPAQIEQVLDNTYRITAVTKVETDIITSIIASLKVQATMLVIMYIETFKTDVIICYL